MEHLGLKQVAIWDASITGRTSPIMPTLYACFLVTAFVLYAAPTSTRMLTPFLGSSPV